MIERAPEMLARLKTMFRYRIPAGVEPVYSKAQVWLKTRKGGRVLVDRAVLKLWQAADQHNLLRR